MVAKRIQFRPRTLHTRLHFLGTHSNLNDRFLRRRIPLNPFPSRLFSSPPSRLVSERRTLVPSINHCPAAAEECRLGWANREAQLILWQRGLHSAWNPIRATSCKWKRRRQCGLPLINARRVQSPILSRLQSATATAIDHTRVGLPHPNHLRIIRYSGSVLQQPPRHRLQRPLTQLGGRRRGAVLLSRRSDLEAVFG